MDYNASAMESNGYDQHTLGHIDCPACERSRIMQVSRIVPSMRFQDAAEIWLQSRISISTGPLTRARWIRATTEKTYRQYIDSLALFFGQLTMSQIHAGHLRAYQEARVAGAAPFIRKRRPNKNVQPAPCPASPKKCNQELSILKMILRRAECWTQEMDVLYQPFAEEIADIPRALTPEEQMRWLMTASSRERWWLVHWYSLLAFETSMGTNEMRSLRIGDINLGMGLVNVPAEGAKNKYRRRSIPICTPEGAWAAEQLVLRARDLGAVSPLHYVFPWRRPPGAWDAEKPMTVSGIKRLWDEVREASGLLWFRPYDTRHTAISRWAESGVPGEVIRARAGHVSEHMMRRYTHISEQAQRRAMGTAIRKQPESERGPMMPFWVVRAS